jgi:hypothetical protein
MEVSTQLHALAALLLIITRTGGWVGPRTNMNTLKTRKTSCLCLEWNPDIKDKHLIKLSTPIYKCGLLQDQRFPFTLQDDLRALIQALDQLSLCHWEQSHLLSCWFLTWLIRPWWWRLRVPPKRRLTLTDCMALYPRRYNSWFPSPINACGWKFLVWHSSYIYEYVRLVVLAMKNMEDYCHLVCDTVYSGRHVPIY